MAERRVVAALLRCPACHGGLRELGPERLGCTGCDARYPVAQEVADFLDPEERRLLETQREGWGGERLTTARNAALLARLRRLVPPPAPFLNLASGRNLARLGDALRRGGGDAALLDLGSGSGGGAGMRRLGADLGRRLVHLDIDRFPGVEVVASGARLPFAADSFAAVLLKAVLEHVPDSAAVLAEAHRVLVPGGWLYVEVPFLFEYHPNPGDYRRFTRAGLEQALQRFAAVEVGPLVGPWAALASLAAHDLALLLSGRSRLLRKGWLALLTWLTWPLALPDLLVLGHPSAHFVAHHLYAFAMKPGSDPAQGPASGAASGGRS